MKFDPDAVAPGVAQFRGYQRSFLRGDVMGGFHGGRLPGATGDGVRNPGSACRRSTDSGAHWSRWWSMRSSGTSRLLSAGPESTTALMTVTAVAPLAAGDTATYVSMAAVLAIMVGAVRLFAGLIRLGFLADLLSRRCWSVTWPALR